MNIDVCWLITFTYKFIHLISKFLYSLNDMPDVMKQMPPLPVKVNEELATHVGIPPHQMQSWSAFRILVFVFKWASSDQ